MIDLDQLAGRREATEPEGIPLRFRGEDFLLPAELPADAFDSLIDDDRGVLGLARDILDGATGDAGIVTSLVAALLAPGNLIRAKGAVEAVFESLFGVDDYARFKGLRPSVADYGRIVNALRQEYGVSLGEAFASLTSSGTGGATSNPTSPDTTSSTPAKRGGRRGSAAGSSASGDSAT